MFRKAFTIEDQEVSLTFTDYISEDSTIYMITGLPEPLFMGYSGEENEWLFLTNVPDALLDLEEEFSELILEQEDETANGDMVYKKAG